MFSSDVGLCRWRVEMGSMTYDDSRERALLLEGRATAARVLSSREGDSIRRRTRSAGAVGPGLRSWARKHRGGPGGRAAVPRPPTPPRLHPGRACRSPVALGRVAAWCGRGPGPGALAPSRKRVRSSVPRPHSSIVLVKSPMDPERETDVAGRAAGRGGVDGGRRRVRRSRGGAERAGVGGRRLHGPGGV